MENNETIAELYALRAGLSLIAQENGKLNYDVAVPYAYGKQDFLYHI